jgi:hypothetical protein
MKNALAVLLAAGMALSPMIAQAQDHRRPPHGQQYPKGWGPHRSADRDGYYHGYRGSHEHRRGYRRGPDGFWYPAAAFAIGAIIGGALQR